MKTNKMGIALIFLFVFWGNLFAQENFSERIYSSYEKEIYISRNGYNIYIVRDLYRDDRLRYIYVLTIELDDNKYLNFRYSPRGGSYAIDYITDFKIERGTLYMKFISSYQGDYTDGNELNISGDFDNFEVSEQINIYFGSGGEKRYGMIFEDSVYYQYVFGAPNFKAPLLCYIIDGYISLGNERYLIPSGALRAIQDFALIMDVIGLR
jgi:hypothetical protein